MDLSQVITNNVGAVITVGIFIWYLVNMGKVQAEEKNTAAQMQQERDRAQQELFNKLATGLDNLSGVIASLDDRLKSIEITRVSQEKKLN